VPAPRVTCPKCGKQQALPLPGAGGRRWCSATWCEGKLDEALHGAAMRELQDQAERIGIEAAAEMLRAASSAGSAGAMLNKKAGE
jgi:hypothetical protein